MSPKRKPGWTPPLRKHKGPDGNYRGRVRFPGGHDRYCGRWPAERPEDDPPPEVLRAYRRLLAEWLAGGGDKAPGPRQDVLTVGELLAQFKAWADSSEGYRRQGKRTSEYYCFAQIYTPVLDLYESAPAADFGPVELRAVREAFTRLTWERRAGEWAHWSRGYVNDQVHRVRRLWSWGVERGLVPQATLDRLLVVQPLRRGKTAAPESAGGKRPVPWAAVAATLPHLPPVLADLVRVHWLLGCRANEACGLTPADIDRDADPDARCWRVTPSEHKRSGGVSPADVHYWAGPRCQALLGPYLERAAGPEAVLFPSPRIGRYSKATYNQEIRKAIARAARAEPPVTIPPWSCGRVRHGRATEVRGLEHAAGRHGREGASAVLGHEESDTTIRYASKDALARRIQAEQG